MRTANNDGLEVAAREVIPFAGCGDEVVDPADAPDAEMEPGPDEGISDVDLAKLERPLSIEMLHRARDRELLSIADLPLRHGVGEDLDRTTGGGLAPGDLIAVGAAGSGAGKTAFMMQIVDGLALRSEDLVRSGADGVLTPSLTISELPPDELAFRTLGRVANVAHSILLAGKSAERYVGVAEVDHAFRAAEALLRGPLAALPRWQIIMRPHEDRNLFMEQVKPAMDALRQRTARLYPGRTIWPVLAVDPIQRWQDPAVSEVEALSQLAEDLDSVADREGWICLLTSDTNKTSATGENGSGVGAFRGSMKLQHACDIVLLLEVGERVADAGTPRKATVEVLKTRRGPAGTVVSYAWHAGRGLRFEPVRGPAKAAPLDPKARMELLRALIERETNKGTVVTRRKLRAYLDELQCPEKKIERLVDDALAAGLLRVEAAKIRGARQVERLLPGDPANAPEHWSNDP
jgi:hypothetical protein